MKEEDNILKKAGREMFSCARVDIYFENLLEIMNRLPEKERLLLRRKNLRCGREQSRYIWRYGLVGAALIIRVAS